MNSITFRGEPADQLADTSGPVEYKDAPITFTLHEVRRRHCLTSDSIR